MEQRTGSYRWHEAKLGDLIEHQKGFAFKSSEYEPSGHPVVRVSNFTDRSIDASDCKYIAQSRVAEYEAFTLKKDDVVIATVGSWPSNPASVVGKAIRVPEFLDQALLNQNAVRLRTNGGIDQAFLFHLLKTQDFQDYIIGTAQGSANQASITLKAIFDFSFFLPPLGEQKKIAYILGTLDNKIELNQQMNRTLEGIARALFKSWFIDFDPVRAKLDGRQPAGMDAETAALFPDSFEDSPLGKIPKGWEVQKIGEVATINSRSIKKGYNHETIEYVDIASVTIGKLENTTTYILSDAPSRAKRLVKHGDIIWSGVRPNRRSYLFIHTPPENLVVSTGFVVLTPKSIPASYLYAWVTTDEFVDYLTFSADGSAYPAVRPDRFSDAKILVAPDGILNKFEQQAGKLRDKIIQNDRESLSLAATRDALLPKLLSGEIRVKEAEQALEEVT